MFARTPIFPLLAGGLLLAGCGDASLTDPLIPDGPQMGVETVVAGRAEKMVPIRWTYHATAAGPDLLWCEDSSGKPLFPIPVNYAMIGKMSHLGRLNPEASGARFTSCLVNIAMVGGLPVPVSAVGEAHVRLVGANGDAVYMEGALTLSFAENIATGD